MNKLQTAIQTIQTTINRHPGLSFAMLLAVYMLAGSIEMWGVK